MPIEIRPFRALIIDKNDHGELVLTQRAENPDEQDAIIEIPADRWQQIVKAARELLGEK